jgi:hypothetical protein
MNVSILMLSARIALVVCLYAFLALILVTLWRDLHSAAGAPPAGSALYSLRRLRDDGSPDRVYPLQKESCFIGRSPSVEISLVDETVSVVHARLWKKAGRWWLEDLDSRNGTLLNDIPVSKKAVLCSGDRIRIGRIVLEFRLVESPATAPASPVEPTDKMDTSA